MTLSARRFSCSHTEFDVDQYQQQHQYEKERKKSQQAQTKSAWARGDAAARNSSSESNPLDTIFPQVS